MGALLQLGGRTCPARCLYLDNQLITSWGARTPRKRPKSYSHLLPQERRVALQGGGHRVSGCDDSGSRLGYMLRRRLGCGLHDRDASILADGKAGGIVVAAEYGVDR